jgi:chromosomal replication initiation ATPase DnaA
MCHAAQASETKEDGGTVGYPQRQSAAQNGQTQKEAVKPRESSAAKQQTQPTRLADLIEEEFGIPWAALMSDATGSALHAGARAYAMYAAHHSLCMSTRQIADWFGRDHSSVISAIQRAERDRTISTRIDSQLAHIDAELQKLSTVDDDL